MNEIQKFYYICSTQSRTNTSVFVLVLISDVSIQASVEKKMRYIKIMLINIYSRVSQYIYMYILHSSMRKNALSNLECL